MNPNRTRRPRPPALLALVPLVSMAACSSGSTATPTTPASISASGNATEAATDKPRLVLTHEGGIQVLDATTLDLVADIPIDGFTRLNPVGDGRHLAISTTGGFRILDVGTWGEAHGDHAHHFTADPALTDLTIPAEQPGHVVVHDGRTAFFDDGTGRVVITEAEQVVDPARVAVEHATPTPHHGVAVPLGDGSFVVSEGTADSRSGIRILDAAGVVTASSDDCPGVHGESVAAGDAVVIGCEDGALVAVDGVISKVTSPDAYGRIGNQAGSEVSPVVLGDYKTDREAELERPTRVSLVDTRTATVRLVDLPSSYTFRSLGRGDAGEGLVLGTDGHLHVIDPETGALLRSVPVIDPWQEPLDWQDPRPALWVHAGTAYVSDPATRRILAVDVETGETWRTATLTVTPNELTGVPGTPPEG